MVPRVNDALARLTDAGLDLAHAFDARTAAREPGWERLGEGRAVGNLLGILVGNTRALWPRFDEARRDPVLAREPHPLDRYVELHVDAAFPDARIYYAHRTYDGAFLPFQRLAVATGLGALSPSQLVVHPTYGPWFALRAVVVVAVEDTPPVRSPIASPCRCTAACREAFDAARDAGSWEPWLAVRDACTLRAFRYSDEQIRYHYERGLMGLRRDP
jgi:hypothetical protein